MHRYTSFVVFAEMRTGSNYLEAVLNRMAGVTCHGEAFNPGFIGHQDRSELFGVDLAQRDADPARLLAAMKAQTPGLPGFRYFHDHDPRVLAPILDDPACAKIVLTRNPLESYVSLKIARATGQWKLTDAKDRKSAKPSFEAEEFHRYLHDWTEFRGFLIHGLQERGQAPFHLDYEDIGKAEVISGLARWLGVSPPEDMGNELKPQNPEALDEKVGNPEEMSLALSELDPFGLFRVPGIEPTRGPAVPTFLAGVTAPVMFLPIKGGPTARVTAWMAALDDAAPEDLVRGFSQKTLRQWKNHNKGGRCFTVVSHPAIRLHRVFCRFLLNTGPGSFSEIRNVLRQRYNVPLPEGGPGPEWSTEDHKAAFVGFLQFARANLTGQTSLRTDPAWSSQAALLEGFTRVLLPDAILRETRLGDGLRQIAEQIEVPAPALPDPPAEDEGGAPFPLKQVYDDEVETAVRAVHNRDYVAFGFRPWSKEK